MAAMIFNARNFQSNMKRIQGEVGREIHQAVMDAGNKLVTMTYKDVPYEKGALRTGGRVQIIGSGPTFSQGLVQYDAYAPHNFFNYALLQHERGDFNHRVGKDHYLSDNVDGSAEFLIGAMARRLRQIL